MSCTESVNGGTRGLGMLTELTELLVFTDLNSTKGISFLRFEPLMFRVQFNS